MAGNAAASNADSTEAKIYEQKNVDPMIKGTNTGPCSGSQVYGIDYRKACQQYLDNEDARDTDRNVALAGYAVAGVGLVATIGAYFLRTKPRKPQTPAAELVPVVVPVWSPSVSGLSVGGVF